MTRISDLSQYNQTASNLRDTQNRINDLMIQASTGYKTTRYSGIAAQSRQLVSLEANLSRMAQFKTNNEALLLRLGTMEQSSTKVFDIASQLKTTLTNALNSQNATELPLAQEAQDKLQEVARQLNVKVGDRYLFGGSRIDAAPVDLADPDFLAPPTSYPSAADTSYYQGDDVRLSAQAADDYVVSYGATADEPAFEKVIRALKLVATVTTTPTIDRDRLNDALRLANEAIQEIPDITSRLGTAQNAIASANEDHDDLTTYLEKAVTDITAVDIPQVMTRMTADQTLLEASYMTISTLGRLSLTNYLR